MQLIAGIMIFFSQTEMRLVSFPNSRLIENLDIEIVVHFYIMPILECLFVCTSEKGRARERERDSDRVREAQ
jgi:hypothetical protein